MSRIVVATLYKFVALEDFRELRGPLRGECAAAGVKGTLLLAAEGINGVIAGPRAAVERVLAHLRRDARLADIEHGEAVAERAPFFRMKVDLRREIVAMGVPGLDPAAGAGTRVAPRDWNAVVGDPEILLVDARNGYEVAIGRFRGALDPQTARFREFPAFVRERLDPARHRKVALYCTGGIRCEKAAAFMRDEGFAQVLQLRGGILGYLAQVPRARSAWEGECFVFDNRVALDHQLREGSHQQCHGCRRPVGAAGRRSPLYRPGVSCPACHAGLSAAREAGLVERRRQARLAASRGQRHIGAPQPASGARGRSGGARPRP